jgi:hypothetical protein
VCNVLDKQYSETQDLGKLAKNVLLKALKDHTGQTYPANSTKEWIIEQLQLHTTEAHRVQ